MTDLSPRPAKHRGDEHRAVRRSAVVRRRLRPTSRVEEPPSGGSTWVAALDGVIAGAVSIGVATLLAGVLVWLGMAGGTPSPIPAVAGAFIDRTPPWLKDFAVSTFGTNDKLALTIGMSRRPASRRAPGSACSPSGAASSPPSCWGWWALLGMAAVISRPDAVGTRRAPDPASAPRSGSTR